MNVFSKKVVAVSVGLLSTIILLLLPTTVVNNKNLKILGDNEEQESLNTFDHQTKRLASDKRIDSLRRTFKVDSEATQIAFYQALIKAFETDNRYDSALLYMNRLYLADSGLTNLGQLASLYFQAFTFAIEKKRVEFFRTKAQLYLQKLRDASQNNKEQAEAEVRLGLTYVSSSAPMRGILMIRDVLNQNPTNLLALRTMGDLALQSNQTDKAIAYFTRYIALDSSDALIYYYLGTGHKQLEQTDLAQQYLLRAQELGRDDRLLRDIEKALSD